AIVLSMNGRFALRRRTRPCDWRETEAMCRRRTWVCATWLSVALLAALASSVHAGELFRWIRGQIVQVTNFHRADTRPQGFSDGDLFLLASADPLGTNRFHDCQLFRLSLLGSRLRQLTHFTENQESALGCSMGEEAGCGIASVDRNSEWHRFVFYSDCNPFG